MSDTEVVVGNPSLGPQNKEEENALQTILWERGEQADMEVFITGTTVKIANFIIPEKKRGQGIGSDIMEDVIRISRANGMERIRMHIGWTNVSGETCPEPSEIENDPSLQFVYDLGFTCSSRNPSTTILATKKL